MQNPSIPDLISKTMFACVKIDKLSKRASTDKPRSC